MLDRIEAIPGRFHHNLHMSEAERFAEASTAKTAVVSVVRRRIGPSCSNPIGITCALAGMRLCGAMMLLQFESASFIHCSVDQRLTCLDRRA
jgi:hypothetical protein